jgi:hypothetical protein
VETNSAFDRRFRTGAMCGRYPSCSPARRSSTSCADDEGGVMCKLDLLNHSEGNQRVDRAPLLRPAAARAGCIAIYQKYRVNYIRRKAG